MILGDQALTVVRPARTGWRGDPGDPAPAEWDVEGCSIQPASGTEQLPSENVYGGDLVITVYDAWLPAGTDVQATDKIRFGGTLYEVDGAPLRWLDHHVQIRFQQVRG